VDDQRDRLGSSGVFKRIVNGARQFKRAVTGGDDELGDDEHRVGEEIGRAFVAGRFHDVHAMGTPSLQQRTAREQFESRWRTAARQHLPFTSFAVANAGYIELGFIPGLEDVPQDRFAAFLEIEFASPEAALGTEDAFVVGCVLLHEGGALKIGAIHTQ
jgi:hypothetical protein